VYRINKVFHNFSWFRRAAVHPLSRSFLDDYRPVFRALLQAEEEIRAFQC